MFDPRGFMFGNPMMPFPLGMMSIQQVTPNERNRVPERIKFALEFLHHLTVKTQSRVAVNDHHVQEIDGQVLSKSELNAHNTACNVINDYLCGKMELDVWEKIEISDKAGDKFATLLHCMACHPSPHPGCRLCRGSGKVFVSPAIRVDDCQHEEVDNDGE